MTDRRDVAGAEGESGTSDRISVLHVVSYYPPDRIGGVGEHVRVIHEGHVAMGVGSEVLTSGVTRSDRRVHRLGRTPVGFVLNSWRGMRLARDRDLIHAHHGEGVLLLLLIRMLPRRPRILVMFHVDVRRREAANRSHTFEGRRYGTTGFSSIRQRLEGLVKAMVEWVVWVLADAVVAETQSVASELSGMRPHKEISVIPHGLGGAPQLTSDDPEHSELLYVGTPGLRKRTHLLPRILREVRRSVPDARLRIVGFDEGGDENLVLEAQRLGVLSAIEFVGPLRSEEVIPYYRAADVLVLPSAYEGLPMVLLEAMREGLVPVATRVSGHPEAIDDGVNGYLVDLDDVDAMAERASRLIRKIDLRTEMSDCAREAVASVFSPEVELQAHVDLYASLR